VDIPVSNAATWTIPPYHELEFAHDVRHLYIALLGA
jgi:hypothetical protein